jgi:hypothetical protein
MQDIDIQQRFHLVQKEVEAAVSLVQEMKLDLRGAIDTLKIEVEILRRFINRYHPDFNRVYSELREEALQEIYPEWGKGIK